jgi:DeoR/GlpR family transcriptional regulator of sugar metabolism
MRAPLRQTAIMDRIERDGAVWVGELARELRVSAATIHRDLRTLADEGLVERVHGGAQLPDGQTRLRSAWTTRRSRRSTEKARIATRALAWVEEGSTIFIDSSTTCAALARAIQSSPIRSLTMVTNSPVVAGEFDHEGVHLIVAPGEVDQNMRLIGGRWTVEFLRQLNFATGFVSAAGITPERGLSTAQRNIADVLGAVRDVSRRTVALLDSSKFGIESLLTAIPAEGLDAVIVDGGLPQPQRSRFRRAGVNLVVAEHGGDAAT